MSTLDVAPDVMEPSPLAQDQPARPSRARSIAAGVLGVLTVVMLVVATVAVWARATVVDRSNFTELVAAGLDEPEVQAELASYLTAQVFGAVDVTALTESVLPDSLSRLVPTVAAGARTAVESGVQRVLRTDPVQEQLVALVGRGHDAAMTLLREGSLVDGVAVVDGAVTVNLLPLVSRGLEALSGLGLLDGVTIPTLSVEGDPDEQREQLAAALGRQLPEDFGQLVVYRSEAVASAEQSLEEAQRLVAVARRGLAIVLILAVVGVIATLVVAPRRWRALVYLGIGVAAAMALLRTVTREVVERAPDLAASPGARALIEAVLTEAAPELLRAAALVMLVGAIGAVIGMARQGWPRTDLALIGAVVVGTAVPALAGVGILTLVLGIAAGIGVVIAARSLLGPEGDGERAAPGLAG